MLVKMTTQFREKIDYLRKLGALDESNSSNPQAVSSCAPRGPFLKGPKKGYILYFLQFFGNFVIFWKIGFLAYLIAPGVLGPLEPCSESKNTPGDLSTASDRKVFIDLLDVGQYFAYKRYFNTIIGPWDLSRIVGNGLIYILTEYNVFWTDPAWSGPGRPGSGPGPGR